MVVFKDFRGTLQKFQSFLKLIIGYVVYGSKEIHTAS